LSHLITWELVPLAVAFRGNQVEGKNQEVKNGSNFNETIT
jgi:hypothetical protein